MSWRREPFRAHYRATIGTDGSSNSYVSYLNLVDQIIGGLDEKLARSNAGAIETWLERQPETQFSRARSRRNCLAALRAYFAFTAASEEERSTLEEALVTPGEVRAVLHEAKALAARYYRLTGKPLGVTGEVAELEASEKLSLTLLDPRTPGHDAERPDGWRVQVKGRAVAPGDPYRGRCPSIKGDAFDSVVLVLFDRTTYDALEIWEASRAAVLERLTKPGSKARNERRSMAISPFRSIATRVWPSE